MGVILGTDNTLTLNTDSMDIVLWRREKWTNKWLFHSVITKRHCVRRPLWLVMPLGPLPISSLLNECTLALIGLICTKKMRGGGGGGEGERFERKGERKSSEWHHNITMQLWAQLANTAGPATVKRLMSQNSKQTLGYEHCFYSITASLIHRNTHTLALWHLPTYSMSTEY